MRTPTHWLRNSILLIPLLVMTSGCYFLEGHGGTAVVEAYQLDDDYPANYSARRKPFMLDLTLNLMGTNSIEPDPKRRTPVERIVLIPFYRNYSAADDDFNYELRSPIVTGHDQRFSLRPRLGLSYITGMGIYVDNRPTPGAFAFAEGCWPNYLGGTSAGPGKYEGVIRSDEYFPDAPIQPPPGDFARVRSFFESRQSRNVRRTVCKRVVTILGLPDSSRLFSLVDGSWELTNEDRLMIYRQLRDSIDLQLGLPGNPSYFTDEFREKVEQSRQLLHEKVIKLEAKLGVTDSHANATD